MRSKSIIRKYSFIFFLGTGLFLLLSFTSIHAQDFPTKPIQLVIPLSAGGSNDTTARTFVPLSDEIFGQPMIIKIRPGGGGAIGAELVAQAKPDGYTLLFGHSNPNCILPAVRGTGRGPGSLAAVCRINILDYVVAVRAESPFKTYTEMIEWAKANPGKLKFGIVGGERSWGGLEWTNQCKIANIDAPIIPYDGGGPALVALLGGHIDVTYTFLTNYLSQYKAGKVRFLANHGRERNPRIPDVPSTAELGFPPAGPGGVWKAVFAPKETPRPIIEKLAAGFKKMTENKEAVAKMNMPRRRFPLYGTR